MSSEQTDEIVRAVESAVDWVPPEDRDTPAETAATAPSAKARGKRKAKAPPAPAAGAPEPPRAQAWGFDVGRMNEEWALVLMGSKAVVVHMQPEGPIEDRLRVLSTDAFGVWFANCFTQHLNKDGDLKTVSWSTAWMQHRQRRQYRGIEFKPDPAEPDPTEGYLNLWRGFAVKPRAKPGGYAVFRDHLFNNVCEGDQKLFDWVFGWFAHIVQKPRERIGTALVMRGKMGTGKTKVGEIIGSLFPSHYFMVDDGRYVTGQFNAHMASCLLLQAEEAVWAGDKVAEGRLKGLVTSKFQMIEAKGIDPIRIMNYVRLIMSSNEDWVVPAGKDERRFCVLDVNPRVAQNHGYFAEMDEEIEAGGREALLHDLMTFDLAKVNLRMIPRTGALLEQKLRSLDPVESWWFDRLRAGCPTWNGQSWVTEIPCAALFSDYVAAADRIGIKRKSEETTFGMKLRRVLPGLKRRQSQWETSPGVYTRMWCYRLPDLDACRAAFEAELGQPVAWDESDLGGRPDEVG